MNLVEQLLSTDHQKINELGTQVIKSRKLARLLGSEDPIDITIQEIPVKRMSEIVAMQFGKKGVFDSEKALHAKAISCVEGIIDPPVRSEELLNHFLPKGGTAKDLVLALFGGEINGISDEISELSGYGSLSEEEAEEEEEEIKN